MALAYFLMWHRTPHAAAELMRAIWRPHHHYMLHVDAKAGASLHATARTLADALPNVHLLPPRLCSWGGWSLVETTLHGIARALALPCAWSHLVPLSEGHVPLCTPDEAAAALSQGVSRIPAARVQEMDAPARADVLHRFAARYRELPGVGMFPLAPRALPEECAEKLHHGSQWMVLSRKACERLLALPAETWAPFYDSLLADETALQTVLPGEADLAIDPRPTTFVAWPHLSGTADWTFSEANFVQAQTDKYLFIRKRPRDLPQRVAEALTRLHAPGPWPELPPPDESFTHGAQVTALSDALLAALRTTFPELLIETLLPRSVGGSPSCFLRLRCPTLPPHLHVALLSEDFSSFKAVLAWSGQPEDEHGLRTLGGYPTWLMKVRLWDLLLMREVLLPDIQDAGFLTPAPGEGPTRLAALLSRVLAAGIALGNAA